MDDMQINYDLDDILSREDYIIELKEIFASFAKAKIGSIVALDGGWGTGKTFVSEKFKNKVASEYYIFDFNAWEYDFNNEPLIPLLFSITFKLNQILKSKDKGKKIIKCTLIILEEVLSRLSLWYTGKNIIKFNSSLITKIIKAIKQPHIRNNFYKNEGVSNAISEIKKSFALLNTIKPVLIIVDEIDRCLPDYGLKVLERLHHLKDQNIPIQILVNVNVNTLKHSMKHIYGYDDKECKEYFAKFFNIILDLNEGNINSQFKNRFKKYISMFDSNYKFISEDDLSIFIKGIIDYSTIRQVVNIFDKAQMLHNKLYNSIKNKPNTGIMCLELLACYISDKYPTSNDPIFECFQQFVCPTKIKTGYINSQYNPFVEHLTMYQNLHQHSNNTYLFEFDITDLWSYIWYAIMDKEGRHSTSRYSLSSYTLLKYKTIENDFKYFDSFIKESHILRQNIK